MATTKLSNSGTTGAKYPTASADNNYMETIASTLVGAGGASSVTFSNIPQGYKHLQVRGLIITSTSTNYLMGFNSDAGTNYTAHRVMGDGTSATSWGATAINKSYIGYIPNSTYPGSCIVDILDYNNTNKYKTFRTLEGSDINGVQGYVTLWSGLWLNTAPVTSILLNPVSGNFNQYTRFSLYGIKG